MGIYLNILKKRFINEDLSEFVLDFREVQIAGIPFRCDNNIVPLGETGIIESEKFSDKTFDPVSFDRVTCLSANGEPQPRDTQPIFLENHNKMLCMAAQTEPI